MPICPSCGVANPEGARFCNACATVLAAEPLEPREERKVVTVLFCDLVGFTSSAERMDPEEVRALLRPYHARLRSELERHGGTVEKFIGDAVMAVFGAPVAHEDDPERAIRAALAIRDALAEEGEREVRIGITTGEALVVLGARPEAGEGIASGDVVNTAARLEAAAPVNGILVDETTYRATERVIDYRWAEPVLAKGKVEAVRVWEALRARARDGVEGAGGALLIGRKEELTLLRETLARVRREHHPQLVTLVGVPGIGKSRLVYELFQELERSPESVYWRHGRSLPYGEGVTFWALAEMIKAHAGILESDSAQHASEKLRQAVDALFPDEEDGRWVERHLGPLVGVETEEMGAEDRRSEAFAAWRRFLEALAEQCPLVLVFEDLHWADEALLDFVDHLVDWASGVPILVLATARPELLVRRPAWGGGKINSATIQLSPLSDDETARLTDSLLGHAVLPADVQSKLLERAGGNPLYAEEFARMLAQRPGEHALPESVQGIIAARLDSLEREEKELLQDAAVIGRVFWLGALGRERWTLEERLHSLERKEFVSRERRSSVAGESEYAFRHALLRDVAYEQIPKSKRADKHRAAAAWITSLGRPEDHAELIAGLYLQALDYARATGEADAGLVEQARLALRAAGERALSLGAFAAAVRFDTAALELWPEDDPARAALLFHCGQAKVRADGTGAEELAQAVDELRALDDRAAAAEAATVLGWLFWRRAERDRAYAYIDQALELVEGEPVSSAKAHVLVQRSAFHMLASEHDEAIRLAREALPLVEQLGLEAWRARALNIIGISRVHLGDAEGLDDLERSVAVARDANAFEQLPVAYVNLRAAQFHLGRISAFEQTFEPYREAVVRSGADFTRRFALAAEAELQSGRGRWDDALRLADELIATVAAGVPHHQEAACRELRAWIGLARGDVEGASSDAERALELARQAKDPQALAPALATRAAVLFAEGRRADASALASEFLALGPVAAAQLDDKLVELSWIVRDLGQEAKLLSVLEGVPSVPWVEAARAIAGSDFRRAADVLAEIGFRPGEAYTRLRTAELLVQEGRSAEAEPELAQALAFYREAGATRFVRQAEALRAASVEHVEGRRVKGSTATNR